MATGRSTTLRTGSRNGAETRCEPHSCRLDSPAVSSSAIPPDESPETFYQRINELNPVEERIGGQHIVSKVLLKGFSIPPRKGKGHRLTPYNLGRQGGVQPHEMKPRGLRECGKVTDFITYASRSAEELWHTVENDLPGAREAARKGLLHENEVHVRTIKDALALHLVRSQRYMEMHTQAVEDVVTQLLARFHIDHGGLLAQEFIHRYGLYPAGSESLEIILDKPIADWRELAASGAIARVSIESMFHRVRDIFHREWEVEVWHASPGAELLVSDSPCVTLQYADDHKSIRANVAIGDAHLVVLPIAADCLIALGPKPKDDILGPTEVDLFNRIQVLSGYDYVYYRPNSGLERFVSSVLADRRRG